ncbi:hypothetical protein PHMEG_0004468 [Phytophthora megakarya]|uniref:Uncharacterized protein n=1 Tax=Phytophthora megakarya TaxID=4795 RepID=A0A225WTQ6_9STRA|nr:hypothetical protein PHMEG_0004468 [Phytophthora megakarya]
MDPMSKRKRPATKLSHMHDNSWYIIKLNLRCAQCCCGTANPTGAQIERMPGFEGAMLEEHNSSRDRVVRNLRDIEGIDVSRKSIVLYRVTRIALNNMEKLFALSNPGSRVVCQVDDAGRFFRCFLAIRSVMDVQKLLLPDWISDGTHMKQPQYNVDKDGNKRIDPVAVAYVHKETIENFVWVFGNCIVAGIALHDRPTFTDRGKQRSAQQVLASMGLQVNIKFCALNIRFSTVDKFKKIDVTKDNVNNGIMDVQSSRTLREYNQKVEQLQKNFPLRQNLYLSGQVQVQ